MKKVLALILTVGFVAAISLPSTGCGKKEEPKKTETKKTETPKTETPKTETPKKEEPKMP